MQPSGVNPATETPRPIAGRFVVDWKDPQYEAVWDERKRRLRRIRSDPGMLAGLFARYAEQPAAFINDWGCTFDPRAAALNRPSVVPFVLFPKQYEWIDWFMERLNNSEPGLTDKSRDMGVSWLAMSVACTLCTFRPGIKAGFGSRDEDTVDSSGDPDSLFWKGRFFMNNIPIDFRRGWNEKECSKFMRLSFPATGSTITGDAGDNIGRGGRATFYVVDEAAHLKRPSAVEAALSNTTNVRIDISSVTGMNNPFAQKRFGGKWKHFTFHWRDDPRKDDAWYKRMCDLYDPITVAQEIDINYQAAATGILIPAAWVNAAVDADKKLGLTITGQSRSSLDIADEGVDKNAFGNALGIRLQHIEEWSGKGADIFATVARAFHLCGEYSSRKMKFDSDGLGAGARGDARVLNEPRETHLRVQAIPFRGSGAVLRPDKAIPTAEPFRTVLQIRESRKNKDYFFNRKAQEWWNLRLRFQRTFRCVEAGSLGKYNVDDLIVIPSELTMLSKLVQELSQPTYSITTIGKMLVDKQPDGMASPNLADAVMILYSSDDSAYTAEDVRRALG